MSQFSKEERVAFEDLLEEFDDQLVLSKKIRKYRALSDTGMERTGNVIWRPEPYITPARDGLDQTGNFGSMTQLSVPAYLDKNKSVPWQMTEQELRDALQENRLLDSAKRQLASEINRTVMDVAANQGTLVVARPSAATGYDDVAQADAIMNEQGVGMDMRCMAVSSRDMNSMAGNLAARQTLTGSPQSAYDRAYVDLVAGFDLFKLDYANRITGKSIVGVTIDTQVAANNFYVPRATESASDLRNVDNRYQTITVSDTTGITAGDCLTINQIESVHHITKQPTGQLKTFRVTSVDSGTTMTISPPIISNQGGSLAEEQYQNVRVVDSAAAAVNIINVQDSAINPFWYEDAIEIIPGKISIPTNAGSAVIRGTTANGIELVMSKTLDHKTYTIDYRVDTFYGVNMLQPQMAGVMLFGQS